MSQTAWRNAARLLGILAILFPGWFLHEFLKSVDAAEDLRSRALLAGQLSNRYHGEGAALARELQSTVLRAAGSAEVSEADLTEIASIRERMDEFFGQLPPEMGPEERALAAEVQEDLRLHAVQAAEMLRQPSSERMALMPKLDELRKELLRDIHAMGDAGVTRLIRSIETLRDFISEQKWHLMAAIAGHFSVLALLWWLILRGWFRPLKRQAVAADRVAAAHEELASLGTLAGGLAHEIRNPIGAMKNRAYALSLLVDRETNPKAAAQIASIDDELDRVERIVHDFLDYARPSEPKLAPCPLAEFAESFHKDYRGEMEARGIAFHVDVQSDVCFAGDAGQLRHVLLNLTRNAAEACAGRPGAQVTLEGYADHERAYLVVTDNGPGIPEPQRGVLFVPFASTKNGGVGLGLAVSRGIAEKHGGELVLAASEPGATRFELRLPLLNPDAE